MSQPTRASPLSGRQLLRRPLLGGVVRVGHQPPVRRVRSSRTRVDRSTAEAYASATVADSRPMGDGGRRDHQPGRRRGAAIPADRAAVVGVRQLRDPVQGLRPEGRAARPVREDRRRRPGPPLHRRRADGRPPHPVGQGRRLRRPRPPRRRRRGRASARSTRTSSRTTTTCSAASATRMPRVRRKALDHLLACVDVMDATGSRDLKLWFSDGTNYPGQDDIRARQDRLAEALAAVHARLGPDQRMLLEYKFFEPSFYTMDVPGLGDRVPPVRRGRPEGEGRRRHRPPRAGHQHRVHRRVAAARRTGSAASTSTRASTPTTT